MKPGSHCFVVNRLALGTSLKAAKEIPGKCLKCLQRWICNLSEECLKLHYPPPWFCFINYPTQSLVFWDIPQLVSDEIFVENWYIKHQGHKKQPSLFRNKGVHPCPSHTAANWYSLTPYRGCMNTE